MKKIVSSLIVLAALLSANPIVDSQVYEDYFEERIDIKPYLLNDGTGYAAFFINCDDPLRQEYVYESRPMKSASMIKVFILAAAMQQADLGNIDLDRRFVLTEKDKVGGAGVIFEYKEGTSFSLLELLKLMITESDNTATNLVIEFLGMDTINQYILDEGYIDTILQRKMMDEEAVKRGEENYTSVQDLGWFFLRLFDHQCVSVEYDSLMLDIFMQQKDTDGIPEALHDTIVAHKTGELTGVYNDGGIVYGLNDGVLIIMTENYKDRSETIESVRAIARYLYNLGRYGAEEHSFI